MFLLPDDDKIDSKIYISGLYISGFSVYNYTSRNACKITNGFNYFPIAAVRRFHDNGNIRTEMADSGP
jgi:hypothetical protein